MSTIVVSDVGALCNMLVQGWTVVAPTGGDDVVTEIKSMHSVQLTVKSKGTASLNVYIANGKTYVSTPTAPDKTVTLYGVWLPGNYDAGNKDSMYVPLQLSSPYAYLELVFNSTQSETTSNAQLDAERSARREAEERAAGAQDKVERLESKLNKVTEIVQQQEQNAAEQKAKLEAAVEAINKASLTATANTKQKAKLKAQLDEKERALREAETRAALAENQESKLQDELARAKGESNQANQDARKLKDELADAEARASLEARARLETEARLKAETRRKTKPKANAASLTVGDIRAERKAKDEERQRQLQELVLLREQQLSEAIKKAEADREQRRTDLIKLTNEYNGLKVFSDELNPLKWATKVAKSPNYDFGKIQRLFEKLQTTITQTPQSQLRQPQKIKEIETLKDKIRNIK